MLYSKNIAASLSALFFIDEKNIVKILFFCIRYTDKKFLDNCLLLQKIIAEIKLMLLSYL